MHNAIQWVHRTNIYFKVLIKSSLKLHLPLPVSMGKDLLLTT